MSVLVIGGKKEIAYLCAYVVCCVHVCMRVCIAYLCAYVVCCVHVCMRVCMRVYVSSSHVSVLVIGDKKEIAYLQCYTVHIE